METCTNCGRVIANADQRYFDNNRLVCGQCLAILRPPPPPGPLGYAGAYNDSRAKSASGLGIAALVLGILGVLVAWVPFCGIVAIPVAVIGLILGIVGIILARSSQTGMGLPIAGTVLSGVAILLQAGWWILMMISVRNAQSTIANTPATATLTTRPADPLLGAKYDILTLQSALELFEIQNGRYPTTDEGLQALVQKPANVANWQKPYIAGTVPYDPWDRPYVYRWPGVKNPNSFDLYSLGPDGRQGTPDDVIDANE